MTNQSVMKTKQSETIGNLGQWLAEARELRKAVFVAEHKLLSYLHKLEDHGPWRDGGAPTFDRFLSLHKLAAPERYRDFVAAESVVGPDVAAVIGVPATLMAVEIQNKTKRAQYIEQAAKRAESEGFAWSNQQAKTAKLNYEPPAEYVPVADVRSASAADKLREAQVVISRLRGELAEAKREIKRLTAEAKKR